MRISVEKRTTWTPDIEGNMDLPEAEQLRMSYDKPLAYKRGEWRKTIAKRNKDGSIETYGEMDKAAVVKDSNVSVVNLTVEEDGKERQIATGEDLLNTRSSVCSLLVDMLVMQITREDFKAELKNSQ